MARLAKPFLPDYIQDISDLELIIEQLPAMQYTPILNALEQNLHTEKIIEAYWKRDKALDDFEVWVEPSPVISENAERLKKMAM